MYQREIIEFTTEEAWLANRVHDLTSSDVPCLFGVGYQTYNELLESKRNGTQIKVEENERMQWGNALQDSIAVEFAKRNKWTIRKKSEYIRIPLLRIGSSFDFEIGSVQETDHALLEIKNVDSLQFKNNWKQGFEIEATPYIEIQVQHELLVSGLETAYIGVLIGGNEGKVLRRTANKKIQGAILLKCEQFWKRIDNENNRT